MRPSSKPISIHTLICINRPASCFSPAHWYPSQFGQGELNDEHTLGLNKALCRGSNSPCEPLPSTIDKNELDSVLSLNKEAQIKFPTVGSNLTVHSNDKKWCFVMFESMFRIYQAWLIQACIYKSLTLCLYSVCTQNVTSDMILLCPCAQIWYQQDSHFAEHISLKPQDGFSLLKVLWICLYL